MKITIISPGRSKGYLGQDVVIEYTSRLAHYCPIEWKFIPSSDMKEEGEKIIKALPEGCRLIILHEKGKMFDSLGFSHILEQAQNESLKDVVFVIGGAYGIAHTVKEKAYLSISLSALVFPHELVRSILAEQIYRGFTIIKGEKYHHS
ncbi:MAG: 23S rRNA (pseudouridine(1915)-N(3))-methyltransferase RlmH [Candidatus Paceibacterota bacterium]